MIGRLRGELVEATFAECVIDAGGVGYEVMIPLSTFEKLPHPGGTVTLWIHTQVREDAIVLFGFATAEERALFRVVTNVSGVGGKLGLNILSAMPVGNFSNAIEAGDLKLLSRISGIGKRTAERLVVELKGKLSAFMVPGGAGGPVARSEAVRDAAMALESLGYKRDAIDKALGKVAGAADETCEDLLRKALQYLTF